MELRATKNKSNEWQSEELEPGTTRLQPQRSNHWTKPLVVMKAIKKSRLEWSDRCNSFGTRRWNTLTTAPFQSQQQSEGINLPYRCIKPNIEDLVSVSLQRHLGAPFKVTCDASWFEALFDPSLSNLAGICGPRTYIEIPQKSSRIIGFNCKKVLILFSKFQYFLLHFTATKQTWATIRTFLGGYFSLKNGS